MACEDTVLPPESGPPPAVVEVAVVDSAGSIFRSLRIALEDDGAVEVFYQPTAGGRVFRMLADSLADEHDVLLPRLRASTEYRYAVRAYTDAGTSDSIARGTFTTEALPVDVAAFEYGVSGTSTFPMLMVPLRSGAWAGQVAIESDGAIVWFVESTGGTLVAVPVPDSHDMLFIENGFPSDGGRNGIVRVNPRRQVVALLEQEGAEFGQIHHDLTALDSDRVLFLAYDTMTVRDTLVTGESIWEWDTRTGNVAKQWSAWDFLDWDTERSPTASPSNWLHGNSITVGPRGNYVVSFRSLDQIISIASDFESIEWRVGGPGATVAFADSGDVFISQHAATEVAPGRLLLFDNRGLGDNSRALELEIDGSTARSAWEYAPDPPLFAALRGGTYRLANGNTVTIFSSTPFGVHETTPEGAVLWEMTGDLRLTSTFRAVPWYSIAGETEVEAMP